MKPNIHTFSLLYIHTYQKNEKKKHILIDCHLLWLSTAQDVVFVGV